MDGAVVSAPRDGARSRLALTAAAHRRFLARDHRVELTTEAPSPDAIDDGVIPGRVPVELALREVCR